MSALDIDVLVVGGGPAGLYAAECLASRGISTLVCEEHARVGDPVHCTGVLASDSFDAFGLPHDATLNTLTTAQFVSPSGLRIPYSTPTPMAVVIDRAAFDRRWRERAAAAGAEVRVGTRVSRSSRRGRRRCARSSASDWISARLLVLACGANYAFQRRFGLGLPRGYLHTAQRELPARPPGRRRDAFRPATVAPGGFAWAVPVVRPSRHATSASA